MFENIEVTKNDFIDIDIKLPYVSLINKELAIKFIKFWNNSEMSFCNKMRLLKDIIKEYPEDYVDIVIVIARLIRSFSKSSISSLRYTLFIDIKNRYPNEYITIITNSLGYVCDSMRLFNIIKDYWNDIGENDWIYYQSKLIRGRICPECGNVYTSNFTEHLLKHNISKDEYYCKLHGLTELPRCCICNEYIDISRQYNRSDTCSVSCSLRYRATYGMNPSQVAVRNKTHSFQSINLIRNEEGKSIIHLKGVNNRFITNLLKYGTLMPCSGYWNSDLLSSEVKLTHNTKLREMKQLNAINQLNSRGGMGFRSIVNIEGKIFELKSKQEFITLLYFIFILNFDVNNLRYNISQFTPELKYTDFMYGAIQYEVHPESTISDKIKFSEWLFNKYGFITIFIIEKDVMKFIDCLYSKNIPIWTLINNLRKGLYKINPLVIHDGQIQSD